MLHLLSGLGFVILLMIANSQEEKELRKKIEAELAAKNAK